MTFSHILFDIADGIATITLNRPEARNALSPEMRVDLDKAMAEIRERAGDDVQAVILTGAGGAFCAGGDVKSMGSRLGSAPKAREALRNSHSNMYDLMNLEVPVISLVDGAAAGAGANIALAADFVLATPRAFLMQAFVKIGLVPDWGGFASLTRLVGTAKAMELMMTGERFEAAEADRLGLLNRVIPAESFAEDVQAFARRLASGPRAALEVIKRGVYLGETGTPADVLAFEAREQAALFLSDDAREGMRAFMEKRPARFNGSHD